MIDFNQLPAKDKIYYQDDAVVIYCCDNREVLQLFPDKSFDLVLTSPPYDNLREYDEFHTWDFEALAEDLIRVVCEGGIIVWVVGDSVKEGSESGSSFEQALYFKHLGFNIHDTMIWHKEAPPLTHNRYEQAFEYMFIFSNGKPKTFNPIKSQKLWKDNRKIKQIRREKDGSYDVGYIGQSDCKIINNVWHFDTGGGQSARDNMASGHPAIFPEELVEAHIQSWSNLNDVILDPFLGSGTTTKITKKLGRKCVGIEISEKYCEIAKKRCSQSVMRLEIPKETIKQESLL
jgi:DNA modification methylase